MKTLRTPFLLGTSVAVLSLSGCLGFLSSDDDEPEQDPIEQAEEPETIAVEEADVEEEPQAAAVDIAERSLDASVFYAGMEFEFGAMTVTDLDAQSDGVPTQGVELTFDVNAHNPTDQTAQPSLQTTLQWDEPGTGNVIELNGMSEFRQVPPGASASGTIVVTIPPADLELYDDDSARLIVGASNTATAQVPIGANAELITRAPVDQPQIVGTTIEAGPITLTIDGGGVFWHQEGRQVPEGEPLFELYFSVTNDSENQACFPRGEGATLALIDASGGGYADLRVGERCVGAGSTIENITGFIIDDDWAGDYTLELQDVQVHADQFDGETPLTLVGEDS